LSFYDKKAKFLITCCGRFFNVFVPRNLLSIGEKTESLSATVAEMRPLVSFGNMPPIPPIFRGGVAVENLQ